MILCKIKLNNFGLFTSAIVDFTSALTVIIGPNESGKTTLLRAINFLKNCNKMRLEKNINFNLKDMQISPSIEYHLNPSFFDIENKNKPIIIRCHLDKLELVNKSAFNDIMASSNLLKLINDKLDIVFWEENFLTNISRPSHLSGGETIIEELQKLSNVENKLILLDNITQLLDYSRTIELSNLIKKLAENNQVILTTIRTPPRDIFNEYEMIMFSRDQLLTQYLVDTVRWNTKFYNTFIESIENIEKLMAISISQINLQRTQSKMLYLNTIIAMETYLSDAFINSVVNSNYLIKKLLKTSSDFQRRKFKVSELITWLDNMKRSAEEYLLEITYHKIWKVKDMYKNVLEVDFPEDMDVIQKIIMIRHDLVHRNGKTKEGSEIKINKEDIKFVIEKTRDFIKFIDDQLKS